MIDHINYGMKRKNPRIWLKVEIFIITSGLHLLLPIRQKPPLALVGVSLFQHKELWSILKKIKPSKMKNFLVFSSLLFSLIIISFAGAEAVIDNNWADNDLFSKTYSDFDPVSTLDDGLQGSLWDENLITDADPYAGSLADGNTGCSQNIEPSGKKRRDNYCPSPLPPSDLRLSLPQSPFETFEQKNRLNLNLDPVRFPEGTPHFTQMDNIYCGNQQFVVCDSARDVDKSPNGNGKYRLRNVKRGTTESFSLFYATPSIHHFCFSSVSFILLNPRAQFFRDPSASALTRYGVVITISPKWCVFFPPPSNPKCSMCNQYLTNIGAISQPYDGQQDVNDAQQQYDGLNNLNGPGGLNDFGFPDITTAVQTLPEGDVADSCVYFVTLP